VLIYPCCSEFSTTVPRPGARYALSPLAKPASISHTYVLASHPVFGFGGRKAPSSMGKQAPPRSFDSALQGLCHAIHL
jgi:hypothetical protein